MFALNYKFKRVFQQMQWHENSKTWFFSTKTDMLGTKARISGIQNGHGIDSHDNWVGFESSRLYLKVRVTSVVCRCVVLNSLKMHFRVILKILSHRCERSVARKCDLHSHEPTRSVRLRRHLWFLQVPLRPRRTGLLSKKSHQLICDHLFLN